MKQETLQSIKEMYEVLQRNKLKCLDIEKRFTDLENNEYVKEYLSLLDEKRKHSFDINSTDDDLLKKAYRTFLSLSIQTNKIYFYMGTFRNSIETDIFHGRDNERVTRDDPNAEFCIYKNIENDFDIQSIPISQREEFEKNSKIIFTKSLLKDKEYYQFQKAFVKLCIEKSQEQAVKEILERTQNPDNLKF